MPGITHPRSSSIVPTQPSLIDPPESHRYGAECESQNIYKQFSLKFGSGDFLVLYTDGVTDALDVHGNEFGLERLERLVLDTCSASAAVMMAAIEKAIKEFVGNALSLMTSPSWWQNACKLWLKTHKLAIF